VPFFPQVEVANRLQHPHRSSVWEVRCVEVCGSAEPLIGWCSYLPDLAEQPLIVRILTTSES
jgi:hypothetical protein